MTDPIFMVADDGACSLATEAPMTFRVGDGEAQAPELVSAGGVSMYKIALSPSLPDVSGHWDCWAAVGGQGGA